jgi:DNA topoisomerase-1
MNLIICEKEMAARRIAYILSNGNCRQSRLYGVPYYTFDEGEWRVIGLKGHIMKLDYPPEYNQWRTISPKELVDVEPVKKIAKKNIAKAIKKLSNNAEKIIVATDYDREGELIGVEGIQILPKIDAKRARFSSLAPYEIKEAFENLGDIDYNLSKSAEARQMIDLAWGASLTRFISLASGQLGKDFLSVGRVQSPTLKVIVDKEKKIRDFSPTPYWEIKATTAVNGKEFTIVHSRGKFPNEREVNEIYKKINGIENGEVIDYKKEKKEEYPPPPFNTTSFLESSSYLGYSASSAMDIAERLYMEGMISYPRTDNTVYPKLPIEKILDKLSDKFPKEVDEIKKNGRKYPVRGKKMATDHPPIHPVDIPKEKEMDERQWKIYELIARRFLATLAKNAVCERSTSIIDIGGERFEGNGYEILEKNWHKIYPYIHAKEIIIPEMKEGAKVAIIEIKKLKKETKPPSRYSQGKLIREMEKLNLGTKSTRHEIIKKLYNRGYINGKYPSPTPSAIAVIDALGDSDITKADMTAKLEEEMGRIGDGKREMRQVVIESRKMLVDLIESLENRKGEIGEKVVTALSEQNFFGKCPLCGKDLLIRKSKKGKRFIGCSNYPNCKNSYPLPQKGKVFFANKYCDECKSPIVKIVIGRKGWESCANADCPSKNRKNRNRK